MSDSKASRSSRPSSSTDLSCSGAATNEKDDTDFDSATPDFDSATPFLTECSSEAQIDSVGCKTENEKSEDSCNPAIQAAESNPPLAISESSKALQINWGAKAESIQCIIRIRPLLKGENLSNGHSQKHITWTDKVVTHKVAWRDCGFKTLNYKFNSVLGPAATQYDVFEAGSIETLVLRVIEGFNATCISYGQTSSGKTFTMEGFTYERPKSERRHQIYTPHFKKTPPDDYGLCIRAIRSLFAQLQDRIANPVEKQGVMNVTVSFCQLYQDIPYDLLTPGSSAKMIPLKIRWRLKTGFYCENLYTHEIKTPEDAIRYLQIGVRRRVVASHRLNKASSRSHCLYTITVERICGSETIKSKLTLVDLAGSERASQTGAQVNATTFKEAIKINRSLMVLRNCVDALAKGDLASHIPYRDSALTKLLKTSLGGNSLTLLVACIVPSDKYSTENGNTLRYAAKASKVSNTPIINEDPQAQLIRSLRKQIIGLKKQLTRVKQVYVMKNSAVMPHFNQLKSPKNNIDAYKKPLRQISQHTLRSNRPKAKKHLILEKRRRIRNSINDNLKIDLEQTTPYALNEKYADYNERREKLFGSMSARTKGHQIQDELRKSFNYIKERNSWDEALPQKLTDGIGIITELITDNNELRKMMSSGVEEKENAEFSSYVLHSENEELRERIRKLEALLQGENNNTEDASRTVTPSCSGSIRESPQPTIMIEEFVASPSPVSGLPPLSCTPKEKSLSKKNTPNRTPKNMKRRSSRESLSAEPPWLLTHEKDSIDGWKGDHKWQEEPPLLGPSTKKDPGVLEMVTSNKIPVASKKKRDVTKKDKELSGSKDRLKLEQRIYKQNSENKFLKTQLAELLDHRTKTDVELDVISMKYQALRKKFKLIKNVKTLNGAIREQFFKSYLQPMKYKQLPGIQYKRKTHSSQGSRRRSRM